MAETRANHPRPARTYAEFMQVWEEGYVSTTDDFENMHMQGVAVCASAGLLRADGTIDRDRIRRWVGTAVSGLPYARLRLMRSALGLTPPAWVPAGPVDLDNHVRFADEPVDLRPDTLRRLIGWTHGPLDIRLPLWRLQITPLADGRIAVGVLMHHSGGDALRTLTFLAALTTSRPDAEPPKKDNPLDGALTPTPLTLPWLALRRWAADGGGAAERWRTYWRKPVLRRARRVAARITRPLRDRPRGVASRTAAYGQVPADAVQDAAAAAGGTMNDLVVASTIRAGAHGAAASVRVPVLNRRTHADRNRVTDVSIVGTGDEPIGELVSSVHAQITGELVRDGGGAREVGYTTLVPWLSRTRHLCGAPLEQVIVLPAARTDDELSVFALLYAGALSVVTSTVRPAEETAALAAILGDLGGPS